jgi:hypothetical protein
MRHVMMMVVLSGCVQEEAAPVDTGRPVTCDLVPADDSCPRRLLCCDGVADCWVETADGIDACEADSCKDALAAACAP